MPRPLPKGKLSNPSATRDRWQTPLSSGKGGLAPRGGTPCPGSSVPLLKTIQNFGDISACPVHFQAARPCPRPSPRKHLVARPPGGGELGVRFRCKRWTCPSCSQVRRQELVERLYLAIHQHDVQHLYCWAGDAHAWARIRKAIQRAGGKFVKVLHETRRDKLTVLSTVPLEGAEPVEAAAVIGRFAEALRSVPLASGQPVTYSEKWLPPAPQKHRWRYVADIPASDQHFESALTAQAVDGRLLATILEPKTAAAWRFSDEVSEEERARIRQRLFGQSLPIDRRQPKTDAKPAATGRGRNVAT